jgi:hypothetical protein
VTCLAYSRPLKIEKPPEVALPNPSDHPTFYADVIVQYPLSEELIPLHIDYKMYLEAELYLILGDTAGTPPLEQNLPIDAFLLKGRLDRWFGKVAAIFEPKAIALPIHFGL